MYLQIFSISSLKPCFNIQSAQSKHKTCISFILITSLCSKSISLPGVATMISIPLLILLICSFISDLPYTAITLKSGSSVNLKLQISSFTCIVSSLVGRTIKNLTRWFFQKARFSRMRRMTGRENAKVLPEPVLSLAIISFPFMMWSKVQYCMGNKDFTPFLCSISMHFLFFTQCSRSPFLRSTQLCCWSIYFLWTGGLCSQYSAYLFISMRVRWVKNIRLSVFRNGQYYIVSTQELWSTQQKYKLKLFYLSKDRIMFTCQQHKSSSIIPLFLKSFNFDQVYDIFQQFLLSIFGFANIECNILVLFHFQILIHLFHLDLYTLTTHLNTKYLHTHTHTNIINCMFTKKETHFIDYPSQLDKKSTQNQLLWERLANCSTQSQILDPQNIFLIQEVLSQMLQVPQSIRGKVTTQRLHVLMQVLPIQNHKIRLKTLQLLSQILQNMPNCFIHYFLKHSCFWTLINNGCISKDQYQYQGYCKLIITLFQHRQKITDQTNILKIIDLIPTICIYVPTLLITRLCVRLVLAIQNQNEDKCGLCFRIYSHLRYHRTQVLSLVEQLQLKHRINTSKLFKNGSDILQIIIQNLCNHNSYVQLMILFIKREELSQHSLKSIMNNIILNFQRSDSIKKRVILQLLYALYETQFVNWYFRREQTTYIVSLLIQYSISAIQTRQLNIVEMSLTKLYKYLHGESSSLEEQKLRVLFFEIISKTQNIDKLTEIERGIDLQISQAVRTLLQLIRQGYSDTSHTFESLNLQSDPHNQPMQLESSEQRQSESSHLRSYEYSDSYFSSPLNT